MISIFLAAICRVSLRGMCVVPVLLLGQMSSGRQIEISQEETSNQPTSTTKQVGTNDVRSVLSSTREILTTRRSRAKPVVDQSLQLGWPGAGEDRLSRHQGLGKVSEEVDQHLRNATPVRLQERLTSHFFSHRHPDDPGRHVGKGIPLMGTSWLNRPLHAGWFVGGLFGAPLVNGRVDQGNDLFGGYRIGQDFSHYRGIEARLGFANLPVTDGITSPAPKDNKILFYDLHLMYYPWGDSQIRPYTSLGLGLANFRFNDENGVRFAEAQIHFPIGIGVKYQAQHWLALRVDAMDNIAFGSSGIQTMHNFSLTAGVEVRFGGRRRSYYPWNPSRHLW